MSDIAEIEARVVRLTYNGAVNMRKTVARPSKHNPLFIGGDSRIFTGGGKWTSLAAIGVRNHLVALGLAEMRPTGTYWHGSRKPHQENYDCEATPLGLEVGAFLVKRWDDLVFNYDKAGKFRVTGIAAPKTVTSPAA